MILITMTFWVVLVLLAAFLVRGGKTKFERLPFSELSCPPGQKRSNRDKALFSCLPVSTKDVKDGMKWMSNPPRLASVEGCKKKTTVQGFSVCEDRFQGGALVPSDSGAGAGGEPKCVIWSVMATQYCDDVGTLEFERYWAKRGCRVELYQYMMYIDGKLCKPKGKADEETSAAYWEEAPNLHVHRLIVWARRCYMCFYKEIFQMLYGTENDRSGGINNGTVIVDAMKFQSRIKTQGGGLGVDKYHPLNVSTSPSTQLGDIYSDVYDGVQYAILSDLFLYVPRFVPNIRQILVTVPFTKYSLIDNLGRETENGFNMYASAQLLTTFRAVDVQKASLDPLDVESGNMRPLQLQSYLADVGIDSRTDHFFSLSLVQLTVGELAAEGAQSDSSVVHTTASEADPRDLEAVSSPQPYFVLPDFCSLPKQGTAGIEKELRLWIEGMLQSRCVPERMWLPCERKRPYGPFLPCPQQLRDGLAFDYAVARGWCNFNHKASYIPPLESVAQPQSHFTTKTKLRDTSNRSPRVRIAFFFTIYADESYVRRLMQRLYSPDHYYMLHIDPTGSTKAFEEAMHAMVGELTAGQAKPNIVIAKEVAIIYGAATASILLSRAMSWFDNYASGWDYFVPLTGSDYPLVSLRGMERILGHRQPHMPFLMAWSRETSESIQRLRTAVNSTRPSAQRESSQQQSQILQSWVSDEEVQSSIDATWKERGNKRFMGDNLMEVRAYSYAPPLTCNNAQGFYRLDARGFNGTQWLFPNDGVIKNGKGRAMTNHRGGGKRRSKRNRASTGRGLAEIELHNFDGEVRLWRKSDPGTSAAYDRETVRYIVSSEEGRKYYHFFKHMLLGSEEHYYVSLLYNWPRTKDFITDIASQGVWNTWELGEWAAGVGGFRTHTHYLKETEMPILRGLSKRGVFFGRKFGSKNKDLLDAIDQFIDSDGSPSGELWSGFLQ